MDLNVINNEEGFLKIKSGWDSISNNSLTVFQSWDFNYAWFISNKKQIKELYIVNYGTSSKIDFILPGYINHKNQLCFLQSGSADFLNILYCEGADISMLINLCFKNVLTNKNITTINLLNIISESPLLGYLPYVLKDKYFFIFQNTIHSGLSYKGYDPKDYHKNLNANKKKKIRRVNREIPSKLEIYSAENMTFPDKPISDLLEIMEIESIRTAVNFNEILDIHKYFYKQNKLKFAVQILDDKIVSMTSFVNLKENEIMLWIDFYDPKIKNINLKLYYLLMEYFFNQSISISFGTGAYSYKTQNFNPEQRPLFQVFATGYKWQFIRFWIKKLGAKLLRLI